jgi:hypothetical protein
MLAFVVDALVVHLPLQTAFGRFSNRCHAWDIGSLEQRPYPTSAAERPNESVCQQSGRSAAGDSAQLELVLV